jgi:serine/threonine protein phosphatase 1
LRNYWIIGDIHGEVSLLDRLLELILGFGPEQIVFLGDYIDRGPHSREVVERIMGLEGNITSLMGNHELMMLNAIEDVGYGYSPIELWYYNGGEATLQSFGCSSFFNLQSQMDPAHLAFFRNLKMSHTIRVLPDLNVLVSHAGISPAIPVEDQLRMNGYGELHRYILENQIDPGDSFLWVREEFFDSDPALWEGYLVVHGHTPVSKLKRFIASNGLKRFGFVENDLSIRRDEQTGSIVSVDVDSGSVISGRLTGIGFFVEGDETSDPMVRIRSMTVSREEIFPRDLGVVTGNRAT